MSIIEQAARRLEELRRSGVAVPGDKELGDRAPVATPRGAPPAGDGASRNRFRGAGSPSAAQGRAGAQEAEVRSPQVRLNLAALAAQGYLTPDEPRSRIADEFRVIKRPLLNNTQRAAQEGDDRARNLIMVTSAMPGEGKTFVSINLAMSIAMELDRTVLLVDADVSRPSVLTRLGLPQSKGLLDLLTDENVDMSDVLLRTSVEGLTVMPAGAPQGRATELLASDRMVTLLNDLAGRYPDRILLFDAPPLLASTESRVLATHMDQIIFVVEEGKTSTKDLHQAMQAIESCETVLPVLNKASRSEVGSYYGYSDPPAA